MRERACITEREREREREREGEKEREERGRGSKNLMQEIAILKTGIIYERIKFIFCRNLFCFRQNFFFENASVAFSEKVVESLFHLSKKMLFLKINSLR